MDPKRPLVALLALGIAVAVGGAAVTLATRTLVADGGVDAPALGAALVVTLAVAGAVAAGRRSGAWVANPERYW